MKQDSVQARPDYLGQWAESVRRELPLPLRQRQVRQQHAEVDQEGVGEPVPAAGGVQQPYGRAGLGAARLRTGVGQAHRAWGRRGRNARPVSSEHTSLDYW